MTAAALRLAQEKTSERVSAAVLDALPHPVFVVSGDGMIEEANTAAQNFFQASTNVLRRHPIEYFVPFGSPLLSLIEQVRGRGAPVNEYRVDLGTPRNGGERMVDIYASPVVEGDDNVVIVLQERTIADKIDRQLTHRGAARTVTGPRGDARPRDQEPALGHPWRGPASRIRAFGDADEVPLTRLISRRNRPHRRSLIDRVEVFGDDRPMEREPINIHVVLDRVKLLAKNGVARGITFSEEYDPSLPPIHGNRDQLIQILLNLVKNAAEVLERTQSPEIKLSTAFRPGIRISVTGVSERISLPLEILIEDNGPGVPPDILPFLFDPFVTTKTNGSGLGLALVAKIVGDHGGVIDCESRPGRTRFRILLPVANPAFILPSEEVMAK
jgi:two-component system nitrogen regulation sensor histidine kinase GlnL